VLTNNYKHFCTILCLIIHCEFCSVHVLGEDYCWKSKIKNNSVYVRGPSLFQSQAVDKVVLWGGGLVLGRRGKQSGKIQGWAGTTVHTVQPWRQKRVKKKGERSS
jgi:hypothetical protein